MPETGYKSAPRTHNATKKRSARIRSSMGRDEPPARPPHTHTPRRAGCGLSVRHAVVRVDLHPVEGHESLSVGPLQGPGCWGVVPVVCAALRPPATRCEASSFVGGIGGGSLSGGCRTGAPGPALTRSFAPCRGRTLLAPNRGFVAVLRTTPAPTATNHGRPLRGRNAGVSKPGSGQTRWGGGVSKPSTGQTRCGSQIGRAHV